MTENDGRGAAVLKISQFADKKGVTRQAVYNAISKKGYKTNQLTDSKGHLTEEGTAILEELFKYTSSGKHNDNLLQKVKELDKIVAEQKKTIDEQQKTIEQQAGVIASLTDSVERLSKTAERESQNVSQAQSITAMIKLSREPFLKRLFAGKKEQN